VTTKTRRVALVTGSARGIGAAIALRLAHDGLVVVGADVIEHPDASVFERTITVDLGTTEGCDLVLAECGEVDILVNNAALFTATPLEEAPVAELDRLYAVNLRAPVLLARALAPQMADRGWGRIVNVSSVGAHTGGLTAASAFYSATKAGLLALTRSLARAYGSFGVTVNAIAPGWIETDMGLASQRAGFSMAEGDVPLARSGSPSEVASAVAFLAGDDSSYVTGATLDVNGGWLMR
jgi:3-oxoacyl-[acyl-carrier protein] reductase